MTSMLASSVYRDIRSPCPPSSFTSVSLSTPPPSAWRPPLPWEERWDGSTEPDPDSDTTAPTLQDRHEQIRQIHYHTPSLQQPVDKQVPPSAAAQHTSSSPSLSSSYPSSSLTFHSPYSAPLPLYSSSQASASHHGTPAPAHPPLSRPLHDPPSRRKGNKRQAKTPPSPSPPSHRWSLLNSTGTGATTHSTPQDFPSSHFPVSIPGHAPPLHLATAATPSIPMQSTTSSSFSSSPSSSSASFLPTALAVSPGVGSALTAAAVGGSPPLAQPVHPVHLHPLTAASPVVEECSARKLVNQVLGPQHLGGRIEQLLLGSAYALPLPPAPLKLQQPQDKSDGLHMSSRVRLHFAVTSPHPIHGSGAGIFRALRSRLQPLLAMKKDTPWIQELRLKLTQLQYHIDYALQLHQVAQSMLTSSSSYLLSYAPLLDELSRTLILAQQPNAAALSMAHTFAPPASNSCNSAQLGLVCSPAVPVTQSQHSLLIRLKQWGEAEQRAQLPLPHGRRLSALELLVAVARSTQLGLRDEEYRRRAQVQLTKGVQLSWALPSGDEEHWATLTADCADWEHTFLMGDAGYSLKLQVLERHQQQPVVWEAAPQGDLFHSTQPSVVTSESHTVPAAPPRSDPSLPDEEKEEIHDGGGHAYPDVELQAAGGGGHAHFASSASSLPSDALQSQWEQALQAFAQAQAEVSRAELRLRDREHEMGLEMQKAHSHSLAFHSNTSRLNNNSCQQAQAQVVATPVPLHFELVYRTPWHRRCWVWAVVGLALVIIIVIAIVVGVGIASDSSSSSH